MSSRGRVAAVSRRMLLDHAAHLGNYTSAEAERGLTKIIIKVIRFGPP